MTKGSHVVKLPGKYVCIKNGKVVGFAISRYRGTALMQELGVEECQHTKDFSLLENVTLSARLRAVLLSSFGSTKN